MRALVADDEVTNRILLKRLMARWGYDVTVADNGTQAWEVLRGADAPKLAVLDWQMPGMDGVEICARLKRQPVSAYVYTVLVTHKAAKEDLATGLDAGADDFLRKPFDPEELRSRLGVARRVIEYDKKLEESRCLLETYAREMQVLAEERAEQLVHADRMATLGMLSAGVAHEINNPATFISGNAQTLNRFWEDVAPIVAAQKEDLPQDLAGKVAFILEEFPSALSGIQSGVSRITKIVKGLKTYARHEKPTHELCSASECIERSIELCGFQLANLGVNVDFRRELGDGTFLGDRQQIEQVLVNLLVNAADAMESSEGAEVKVWVENDGEQVALCVQDNGPGIPETILEKVFNPFFTTKAAGKGTGLGLSICSRIASDHRGTLSAENLAESSGVRFRLSLPARTKEVAA